MNKMHKILMSILATVTSTQVVYPIIFTGPARRQAHREQEQEAYLAGLQAGAGTAHQSDQADEPDESDVVTQSIEDDAIGQDEDNTAGLDSADQVMIQALGDGFSQLSPEDKALIKAKLLARLHDDKNSQDVAVQSIDMQEQTQDGAHDLMQALPVESAAVVTDINHENIHVDDHAALEVPETIPHQLHEPDHAVQDQAHDLVVHDLAQAVDESVHFAQAVGSDNAVAHDTTLARQVDHQNIPVAVDAHQDHTVSDILPATHEPVVAVARASQPVTSLPESPVIEKVLPVKPVPMVTSMQPVEQVQPAQVVQEKIKIVKVYPVYDAIVAATKSVKSAALDMVNYLYGFIKK